jgi:hypothetical protein
MKYKTLDWIGRVPLVLLLYVLVKAADAEVTVGICLLGLVLVILQFGAIGRCLYLGKPEASK